MADAIGDLLSKRKPNNEPPEFSIIRKYIQDRFELTPRLSITKNYINITVPNSAVASNIRFELYDLGKILNTKYKLSVRIAI